MSAPPEGPANDDGDRKASIGDGDGSGPQAPRLDVVGNFTPAVVAALSTSPVLLALNREEDIHVYKCVEKAQRQLNAGTSVTTAQLTQMLKDANEGRDGSRLDFPEDGEPCWLGIGEQEPLAYLMDLARKDPPASDSRPSRPAAARAAAASFTAAERAVCLYTTKAFSGSLGRAQVFNTEDTLNIWYPAIHGCVEVMKMPAYRLSDDEHTLYRGTKLRKDQMDVVKAALPETTDGVLRPDDPSNPPVIQLRNFISTSRNIEPAKDFAKSSKNGSYPILEIKVPAGLGSKVLAADIASLSVFPEEEEVYVAAGLKFQLTGISKREDLVFIEVTACVDSPGVDPPSPVATAGSGGGAGAGAGAGAGSGGTSAPAPAPAPAPATAPVRDPTSLGVIMHTPFGGVRDSL